MIVREKREGETERGRGKKERKREGGERGRGREKEREGELETGRMRVGKDGLDDVVTLETQWQRKEGAN